MIALPVLRQCNVQCCQLQKRHMVNSVVEKNNSNDNNIDLVTCI